MLQRSTTLPKCQQLGIPHSPLLEESPATAVRNLTSSCALSRSGAGGGSEVRDQSSLATKRLIDMEFNAARAKARAGGRMVASQKTVFELKHRVVLSLNKLADRDNQQIGVDELKKIVESFGSRDMIAPFLSCITDTDSGQKSAVRRERMRVMCTLARAHGSPLAPHLPRAVASIVKRLKDSDSVVRGACVETCGVLPTSIRSSGGGGGGGSAFAALVRPLLEDLGERNRRAGWFCVVFS